MAEHEELGQQTCYLCGKEYELTDLVKGKCQFKMWFKGLDKNIKVTTFFQSEGDDPIELCRDCVTKVMSRFGYKTIEPVIASGELTFNI